MECEEKRFRVASLYVNAKIKEAKHAIYFNNSSCKKTMKQGDVEIDRIFQLQIRATTALHNRMIKWSQSFNGSDGFLNVQADLNQSLIVPTTSSFTLANRRNDFFVKQPPESLFCT